MALLSGTAAQLALDFLRSGRILKEGGLETLQKAYKATNRGEVMPEEAVSEFRRLIDALRAEEAASVIYGARTGSGGSTLRDRLPEMVEFRFPHSIDSSRGTARMADARAGKYKQEAINFPYSNRASDMAMTPKEAMQNFRYLGSRSRAEAQVLDALIRLLGESQ